MASAGQVWTRQESKAAESSSPTAQRSTGRIDAGISEQVLLRNVFAQGRTCYFGDVGYHKSAELPRRLDRRDADRRRCQQPASSL